MNNCCKLSNCCVERSLASSALADSRFACADNISLAEADCAFSPCFCVRTSCSIVLSIVDSDSAVGDGVSPPFPFPDAFDLGVGFGFGVGVGLNASVGGVEDCDPDRKDLPGVDSPKESRRSVIVDSGIDASSSKSSNAPCTGVEALARLALRRFSSSAVCFFSFAACSSWRILATSSSASCAAACALFRRFFAFVEFFFISSSRRFAFAVSFLSLSSSAFAASALAFAACACALKESEKRKKKRARDRESVCVCKEVGQRE